MSAHPNKAKMDAAVQRWIAEAQSRSDGAAGLRKRVTWMGHQIRILGDRFTRTPEHLEGLTAADLLVAQDTLRAAVKAHGKSDLAKAA